MRWIIIMVAMAVAACDGRNENAGERADAAAGKAQAVGQGPSERLGESLDRADSAAREAVESQAELIRDRADVEADALDAQADRLEARADAMRERAQRAADAIEDRASQ